MHFVDDLSHKNRLLDHLLRDASVDQAVVFTATKRDADSLAERLNIAGFSAAALHGDMHQGARNRTLNAMRHGRLRVLVATDVAARGIDVPDITHVINYDMPVEGDAYVHRVGRTGRAGNRGVALSIATGSECVVNRISTLAPSSPGSSESIASTTRLSLRSMNCLTSRRCRDQGASTTRVLKSAGATISSTSKSSEQAISRCGMPGTWLMQSPCRIVRSPCPAYSKVAQPFST